MVPLLAIRFGLCCLLTSVVNGVRDSTVFFEEESEETPNVDRITCIRQDNLDLVVPPSPAYIMRQIIGIGATTAQDIMVVATGIQLDFSAKLEIFRHDATRFRFELTGKHSHEEHDDLIAVNFGLEGLEVITQSTMMDWATSLVTNRDVLAGHQTGYLYLKMSGEAEAVWNEEAKQWKVKLFEQQVEPFSIHITSQWILTEALTRAGGLDQIIAKELWPMIQKTLPPSLGAAFNYVPKEDLWYNLKGTIDGQMAAINSPLTLSCKFEARGEVSPTKTLQVFLELFDLKEMAASRVSELLASPALQSLWVQNKQAFVETLIHYGLVLGDDFIDTARATKDLEELREPMIKAAKSAADGLVKVLQPFVKALSKGKNGFFDGFQLNSLLKIAWGEDTNGKIRGFESTPGTSRVVVPAEFLGALGATAAFVPPEAGNMKLAFTGLRVDEQKADMAQAVMEQVQLSIGNETHPEVWKVDGSFGNFQLRFPTPVVDGLDVSAEQVVLTMDTSGTVTLDTGDGWGFEFDDERGERSSAGMTRSGDAPKADGRLPDQFARPSEVVPRLLRTDLIPTFNIESAITVNDGGQERSQRLAVETTIQINTEVTVIKALPHALAPRSSQDFGYVFYAGQFSWSRISGNAAKKAEDPIIAVVSCGFLRLFTKYIHSGRDLKRIDFTPTAEGGQLELDLSKYTDKLEVAAGSNCVKLVQSGMFPRPAGGLLNWGTVSDELCGQPEDVSKLVEAINLQVARFLDPRASKWNFGTHPADEEAYTLPVNYFTVPLLEVVEETAMKTAMKAAGALLQESDGPSLARNEVAAALLDDKEMILTQVEALPLERVELPKTTKPVKPSPGALLDFHNTVAQGKPHGSNQREQCRVNQDLAAVYFPSDPIEENQPILRLAVPKLPAIGDLHAVLDNIFFTEVAFKFVIGRKDDNTFSFEITGINQEKAVALAFVHGFEFETPDTMVDNLVKGIENVEQAVGKLKVFGAKHKGRLNKGPLDLHFHMKGDFQNEAVNEWGVVQDSVIHDVKIHFGQGGALQGLVNSAINSLGGIDKIFFDSIWPLVESLIPAALGSAFRAVPASAGSIKFEIEVQGQCPDALPEKERKCPSQELDVKVESRMVTYGASDTILSGYRASMEAADEKVPKTLRNIVDAQKSKKVFAHSFIESNIQVAMDKETGLNTDVSMKSALPVGLLLGLAGPAVLDFVPTSGNTLLNGAVELSEGVVHVSGIRIESLRLPLVIKKSDPSAVQMDLSLNSFTAQRMEPVQVGKLDPFSHQAAMSVNAQDLRIQLDEQSGMQLSYNGGNAGHKALVGKPEFLAALLGADPHQPPWSQRKNASERADGAVPSQYKRPAPRYPGVFDLSEVLRKVDASIKMKLLNTGSDEVVHFTVEQQATAKISLSKNVLRGLLDSADMDFGYIYYTVPGFFGPMKKDTVPDARALAVLNCGTLEIYKVSTQALPFEKKFLEASIDLFKDKHDWQLQTIAAGEHSTCLRLGKSQKMGIKVGEANFFCGRAEPLAALQGGILLQQKRFASVDSVAKEYPGSAVAKEALPDGSWFMEFDPYNATTFFPIRQYPKASMVVPPHQTWQDALEYLLNYKPSSKKSWSPLRAKKKKSKD